MSIEVQPADRAQRDELTKAHTQDARQLERLEKTKAELAHAHMEFGQLSQLLQARQALQRMESKAEPQRGALLAAARLRVQECQQRLREARNANKPRNTSLEFN